MANGERQEKFGLNKANIFSLASVFRIGLIVLSAGMAIAAIAAQAQPDDKGLFKEYMIIRIIFIVVGVGAAVISLILLICDWLNIFNVGFCRNIPILFIIIAIDAILFIGVGVLSAVSIIKAKNLATTTAEATPDAAAVARAIEEQQDSKLAASAYYKPELFYAASACGFISCGLYVVEIAFLLFKFLCGK